MAYEIVEADQDHWGAVFRRGDMIHIRRESPNRCVRESALAAGLTIQKPDFKDYPFQFDNFLTAAGQLQRQGRWSDAADVYQMIAERHDNVLWMRTLRANALFQTGHLHDAETIIRDLNQTYPTVARLMIEARLHRKKGNWPDAVRLYWQAKAILDKDVSPIQGDKTTSDDYCSEYGTAT